MGRLLPAICIVIGAALRLAVFPHGLSPTEFDEPGYLADGLQLIEGVTPGHKYAPSGPLTWFGALYAATGAVRSWVEGGPDLAGFPGLLRPAAALEATLFHLYADMSGLRLAAVALIVLLSVVSIAAVCRLAFFPLLGSGEATALALAISVLAQFGDLCESALKRAFGAKDSGWIIPGHGGILDRLDSLLFPVVFTYYYAVLPRA